MLLACPRPDPSARATDNDHVIERAVKRQNPDGSSDAGRITATLSSGPRHATNAHPIRVVAVSMGYDRAAPKRPVNTTLNEDLVRRARVLTPNLSEIAESLLAAYVDDAEAQMVRREQKIAAHISASDAFATRYRALANKFGAMRWRISTAFTATPAGTSASFHSSSSRPTASARGPAGAAEAFGQADSDFGPDFVIDEQRVVLDPKSLSA